jgi:NAD-dependent deacetylase
LSTAAGTGAVRLAELIRSAGRVVALTGAGISVPSGIPDFRSPGTGLWAGVNPMEVAHVDVFRRDPERFWSFYGPRFALLDDKRPNGAHEALTALERRGFLDAVVTQNIDGLHAAAGSRDVIEVHGSVAESRCVRDGATYPLMEVRARLAAAPDGVPRCDCGRPLKPSVVLFGELLPEAKVATLERELERGFDVVVSIGTSNLFPYVTQPLLLARGQGRPTIEINPEATHLSPLVTVKLAMPAVFALTQILAQLDR